MKNMFCTLTGVVGSFIAYALGGWDAAVINLLVFMLIDYISGLTVAGVFHKSPKTETGSIESKAGWKGLIRKCYTLLMVIVANCLDMQLATTYIRDAVCIAFMTNELISIVENCGLMGLPIPAGITNAIEILKRKEVSEHE